MILGMLGTACGGAGACVATGGAVPECKQDWTEEECSDWNSQMVNGSRWDLKSGTCEDNGFSVQCPDGSWVRSSGNC